MTFQHEINLYIHTERKITAISGKFTCAAVLAFTNFIPLPLGSDRRRDC